jgi:ABC-type lipoprotein export system ATPase subunit
MPEDTSVRSAAGANGHMIALADASIVYPIKGGVPVTAVDGVTLGVEPGEFVVITGRSGSGKTTLLNLVAGLTTPTSGSVYLDGVDLWSRSDAERSRLRNDKIGFVFQFPSLIPTLTVLENVKLPNAFAAEKVDAKAVDARARELLDIVGLASKTSVRPRQLSAGQQQRVVLARSLIKRPSIILADEPSSNLDEKTEQEIMALFQQVHRTTGVTILMVTHSSTLVKWCTRAVRMAAGKVTADEPIPHQDAELTEAGHK